MEYFKLDRKMIPGHRLLFKVLLLTGMRHVEMERFVDLGLIWYEQRRSSIVIPEEEVLKVRVKVRRRNIPLSDAGIVAVEELAALWDSQHEKHKIQLAHRASWGGSIHLAAAKAGLPRPETITPKCTRKTWESWLLATYPQSEAMIALAMGHTANTAIKHYVGLGFSGWEIGEIKDFTKGFFRGQA
jgi:integrase